MRFSDRFPIIDIVVHALVTVIVLSLQACGGGGSGDSTTNDKVAGIQLDVQTVLLTGAGQERQLTARATNAGGGSVDAKVVWTSSAPDQVSVDVNGILRSVTPIGSAMIFAEVGGVRSAPALVSTVELRPGTVLLRDADIVAVEPPAATGGYPGVGTRYDIWIAGQNAPAIGTIVLAIETANVSGRVVETVLDRQLTRVRLERLAMPDLLARYDVNWAIELAPYEIVIDEQPVSVHPRILQARERALTGIVPEWKIPREGTRSPCSASLEAKFKAKPLQVKVAGNPKLEAISSRLDDTLPPGRLRVALVGDFYIETSVGLTADAGLSGEAKCELKGHIPLPFLPPPFNWLIKVPVGIGVGASGKVEVVSIDIGLSGKNGAKFEMGIDCTPPRPCRGLDSAQRINEVTPHMEIASAQTEGLKIELEAGAYFLTGIDVVLGIASASYQFNMVEVKVGPAQSANFGTVKRQIDSLPYASDYDLAFVLELGPGGAIKDGIKELLGDDPGELSFGIKGKYPISESPRGSWAPDKTTAIPNRDIVRLNIDLTQDSTTYWKLGYNVEVIEIYHRHESELEFSLLRTLTAIEPQTHFEMTWDPEPAHAGKNEFAVFAVSKLPVVRLEVGQRQAVQVSCIAGTAAQRGGRDHALAAGVCKEEWIGNASGAITGAVEFTAQNFLWEQDLTLDLGPGVSGLRPRGQIGITLTLYRDMGCTVTPERFDTFPSSSLMTVDRNFDPPKYSFGLQVDAELNIACPGGPPFTLPTRVLAFDGAGELTNGGTRMQGGTNTAQGQYRWDFALKVEEPPPSAAASRTQVARSRRAR